MQKWTSALQSKNSNIYFRTNL